MVVIKQLITKQEVAEYRQILAAQSWQDGKLSAMGMAAEVKNNRQADSESAHIQQLRNSVLQRMGAHPTLVSAALPHKIFPPCFNRYGVGERYGFHVDAAIMRMPHSQEVIRSDVSMTLFLSEPDEYDGGELVIATVYGEQRLRCEAGDAVVYPSASLHKVTEVTRGERVAVITWMQSLVSDITTRQTLFQLDQTIQALLSEGKADRQELDNLHNVYHNLVRQFASV